MGSSDSQRVIVAESSFTVLSHWKNAFEDDRKVAMKELNESLKDKQYLACNEFTLTDIILYAVLYNVPFGPADRLEFSNVIRYFDLVQHLVKELVSIPEIKLTAFDLDVPFFPLASENKDKKDDKKDAKKKEDKNLEQKVDTQINKKEKVVTKGILRADISFCNFFGPF